MKNFVSTVAVAGLMGAVLAAFTPAFAGPTNDQAAAESDIIVVAPAASPGVAASGAIVLPGDASGRAAAASNGAAQSRIVGEEQLQQRQSAP